MKSYIQGMITGGVFVFAIMIFMGATGSRNQTGTYILTESEGSGGVLDGAGILNTKTGVWHQRPWFHSSKKSKKKGEQIWTSITVDILDKKIYEQDFVRTY